MARSKKPAADDGAAAALPAETERVALKRERAGTYGTPDGRFTVEQESGRWLVLDTEQTDELGLPLVRGPFDTLDRARDAISAAREAPVPRSPLEARLREAGSRPKRPDTRGAERRNRAHGTPAGRDDDGPAETPAEAPIEPPIVVRRLRRSDERILRAALEEGFGAGAVVVGASLDPDAGGRQRDDADRQSDGRNRASMLGRTEVCAFGAFDGSGIAGLLIGVQVPDVAGAVSVILLQRIMVRAARDEEIVARLADAVGAELRSSGAERAILVADGSDASALERLGAFGLRKAADGVVILTTALAS